VPERVTTRLRPDAESVRPAPDGIRARVPSGSIADPARYRPRAKACAAAETPPIVRRSVRNADSDDAMRGEVITVMDPRRDSSHRACGRGWESPCARPRSPVETPDHLRASISQTPPGAYRPRRRCAHPARPRPRHAPGNGDAAYHALAQPTTTSSLENSPASRRDPSAVKSRWSTPRHGTASECVSRMPCAVRKSRRARAGDDDRVATREQRLYGSRQDGPARPPSVTGHRGRLLERSLSTQSVRRSYDGVTCCGKAPTCVVRAILHRTLRSRRAYSPGCWAHTRAWRKERAAPVSASLRRPRRRRARRAARRRERCCLDEKSDRVRGLESPRPRSGSRAWSQRRRSLRGNARLPAGLVRPRAGVDGDDFHGSGESPRRR
jgi:hypothetical protein